MDDLNLYKIGMELKRLRAEHSYTQEQVADGLGCTVAFISNIENNRAKLNLRVLTYYAKLCNVTVDSILNTGKSDADSPYSSDCRNAEILNIMHQFSLDEQEKIIKVLKYIKQINNQGV